LGETARRERDVGSRVPREMQNCGLRPERRNLESDEDEKESLWPFQA
jgi:hypothetical protein